MTWAAARICVGALCFGSFLMSGKAIALATESKLCGGYSAIELHYVGVAAQPEPSTSNPTMIMPVFMRIRLSLESAEAFTDFAWRLGGDVADFTLCLDGKEIGRMRAIKAVLLIDHTLPISIAKYDRDDFEDKIRSHKELLVGSDGAPR